MKIFKTILCVALSLVIAVAVISPGIKTGTGTLKAFLTAENVPTDNLVIEESNFEEIETHAQMKADALKAEGLNIKDAGGGDYFRESLAGDITPISDGVGFVADELIIMFEYGTPLSAKLSTIKDIDGRVVGYSAILNKYQVKTKARPFEELCSLCEKLTKLDAVALAAPNMAFIRKEAAVPDDPWTNGDGGDEAYGWDESRPNGGNWWLEATETVSAWDYSEYFNKIKVGVLDGGFDTAHEDLEGRISFPSKWFERRSAPDSHGTHVAGIIAAKANNQRGITGICDNAELVCVDWEAESDGQCWVNEERIVTGFIALVKSGAKVINLSLGSSGSFDKRYEFFWNIGMNIEAGFFSLVISRLLTRGFDFVVVQSAGNGDGVTGDPCDSFYNGSFASITENNVFFGLSRAKRREVLNRIIVVGSVANVCNGESYYQSSFSNVGVNVDVCAPGSYVFSCDTAENGCYGYKSGTSMAAPVVTGIAALVWSVNPRLTGAQVREIVCSPENSRYDAVVYYHDSLKGYSYPLVNARLSVLAAIATLTTETEPESESETESGAAETVTEKTTAQFFAESNYSAELVESYRGEKGE